MQCRWKIWEYGRQFPKHKNEGPEDPSLATRLCAENGRLSSHCVERDKDLLETLEGWERENEDTIV